MGKNLVETVIGAVVLVVAVGFFLFAYSRSNVAAIEGYEVSARFSTVDGLNVGDDVRVSGIKVGSILEMTLDGEYFQAVVRMSVDSSIKLPEDSIAVIASEGMLGGKYLALEPGGADELIGPGGEIKFTQSSISLESLLGKAIYSFGGGD